MIRVESFDSSRPAASFELYVEGWDDFGKMVLHQKLTKNGILRGQKLRKFTQNQINQINL